MQNGCAISQFHHSVIDSERLYIALGITCRYTLLFCIAFEMQKAHVLHVRVVAHALVTLFSLSQCV